MTLRRWETWVVYDCEVGGTKERRVGRHFTRRTAEWSISWWNWTLTLAAVAYWNSLWPDDQILSVRGEVRPV